jgi:uncharacterized protein (DUF58 family)
MEDWQAVLLDQLKDSTLQLAFVLGAIFLLARLGKAQPSRRTLILVFLPVLLLALSFIWPWTGVLAGFYTPVFSVLLLIDGFFLTTPAKKLDLSRSLSRKFSIGQQNQVFLTLVNNSGNRLSACVRDSVPTELMNGQDANAWTFSVTLEPYNQQTVSYELFPTRRGLYHFERIHIRYRSHLGLLWMTVQGGRAEAIKVVPDLRRIRRMRILASKAQHVGELQKRALGLEGTQFSGLRHYFPGDDIRKMAWQATARLDVPVVRTFEPEVEQPILVLLDAGRKMETTVRRLRKYDWALNTALAFIGVAIDRRDCVGVGVFSDHIMADIPVGCGRGHLNRILETLGETDVQPVEPDYESVLLQFARGLKRRSLVVIFTDLIDPVASRSLVRSLKGFSTHHLLMLVTFKDSDMLGLVDRMPDTAYDAYCKGVALDLLELRRQTLAVLSRGNRAIVVDAPPESLDEALIRQYLKLKRQGRF